MEEVDTTSEPMEIGRRERNKAEKRQRIIDAARELFAELGFEGTTTAAIARRAGIGTGTLYLYVDSKEDLLVLVFCETIGHVWDDAFARNDPTAPALDQLLAVLTDVGEYHEEDTNLSRAFFKELRFVGPAVIHDAVEFFAHYQAQLRDLLEACQSDGRLDAEVSAADLTNNLVAIWSILMQRRHAGRLTWDQYLLESERSFRTALFRLTPTD